ncbi:MAG: hypothetical protein MJ055_06200 [Phascolarctobacterium sp.]|nr:hypothetical protein [Phascolarctobacterium sp.]MCQ2383213.1 hypothetical protein [Clostridia bacterium]
MRINGAGGCFDNRIYDLDVDLAWRMALLSINEMGVTIDSVDETSYIVKFHSKKKVMQVCIQPLDETSVQVIMDSTKERLEIYSWKVESGEVEEFYEHFEKKLKEYRAFIICPSCSAKISSLVKFCPECGFPINR